MWHHIFSPHFPNNFYQGTKKIEAYFEISLRHSMSICNFLTRETSARITISFRCNSNGKGNNFTSIHGNMEFK